MDGYSASIRLPQCGHKALNGKATVPGMPDLMISDLGGALPSVYNGRAAVNGANPIAIAYGLCTVDITTTGKVGFQLF